MTAQVTLHILGGRKTSWRRILGLMLRPSQRDQLEHSLRSPLGEWLGDMIQTFTKDALRAALVGHLGQGCVVGPSAVSDHEGCCDTIRGQDHSGLDCCWSRHWSPPCGERPAHLQIPYRETSLRGQQEADWIEYLLFFRDILGIQVPFADLQSKSICGLISPVRACGGGHTVAFASSASGRLKSTSRDGKTLHHDAGPAVRFRDGWSIWAIDGVVVDEQVVLHPETQNVRQIRREPNAEVKRIRIERFGWDRYLAEVGAVAIDRRRNDIEATRETLFRTPDRERILVCACPSTARVYALAVPRDIRTCEGAQAWLSGGLAGRIINSA